MRFILITITFFSLFGLKAKAQTREETVQWINEYGNHKLSERAHENNPQYYVKVENGCLIVSICAQSRTIVSTDRWECTYEANDTIRLSNITNVKYNNNTWNDHISIYDKQGHSVGFCLDWDVELDLAERMYKAFQKLVRYNNQNKPKETF
jgi:hypothetical protein